MDGGIKDDDEGDIAVTHMMILTMTMTTTTATATATMMTLLTKMTVTL